MASHGIARTARSRTAEQKAAELEKIQKYRDLEDQVRAHVSQNQPYSPEAFALTTRLLKLNPEYYTVWNVRRRLLISGLLSRRSAGCSPSTASPTLSASATTTASSGASLSSSAETTRPAPASPTAGRSGTTAEATTTAPDASANSQTRDPEADLGPLRTELAFTIPLLLEYPKCYWIWGHRRWALLEVIKRLPVATARRVWTEELGLVSKMLTKDRRNFHAWGYRRMVVQTLETPALDGSSMAEAEFAYTTAMIEGDLSNFSAWHARSKLLPRLLREREADDVARRAYLDKELNLIREALNVGPEDQSLWYYHQYLMLNLTNNLDETIVPNLSQEERISYVKQEITEITDLLEDYDDVKWIYEGLVEYTLALTKLEKRPLDMTETDKLGEWLAQLKKLDPLRRERWLEIERDLSTSKD